MNFEIQENDIIARLEPLKVGPVQVIPMPESVLEFTRNFEDARVTVAFNGLVSPETYSTSNVLQEDRITFAIVFQSRLLRDPDTGIYSMYHKARKLLSGFSPTNCQPLVSKSFDLISDEDDLFTFFAMFECGAVIVEDAVDEADTAVKIKKITVSENGDELSTDDEIFYKPPEA